MSQLLRIKKATEFFLELLGAVALAGYFSGVHLALGIFSAAALAVAWYGIYFFVGHAPWRAQKTKILPAVSVRIRRSAPVRPVPRAANEELLSALTNLGYSKRDALEAAIKTFEPGIAFDEQIRAALTLLAPKNTAVGVN